MEVLRISHRCFNNVPSWSTKAVQTEVLALCVSKRDPGVFFTPVRNEGLVGLKQTNLSSKCWLPIDLEPSVNKGISSTLNEILFTYSIQAKRKATKHPANHNRQDGRWALGPGATDLYIVDAPSYCLIGKKSWNTTLMSCWGKLHLYGTASRILFWCWQTACRGLSAECQGYNISLQFVQQSSVRTFFIRSLPTMLTSKVVSHVSDCQQRKKCQSKSRKTTITTTILTFIINILLLLSENSSQF